MSIQSSTFGGVLLSGEEAEQFIKQLRDDKLKQAAIDSLHQRPKWLKEYHEKGYVIFYPRFFRQWKWHVLRLTNVYKGKVMVGLW